MNGKVDILLVEDNPNDVELTLHAFSKYMLAASVHVARDGEEALNYLFSDENLCGGSLPRLLLLDLKLPKVDGFEVLRRVKGDERLRGIPVVILTTSGEESDIARCYQLGGNSYILKPVDFDQFVGLAGALWNYWLNINQLPRHLF